MKKMLLVLLTLGVIFSCGAKEEVKTEEKTTTETTTEPVKEEGTEATEETAADFKFKDADVQKYVDDYSAMIKDYAAAIESKDAAKIQELTTKVQEITAKSQEVGNKLANDPEEAKKFTDAMTKLGEEFQKSLTDMTK